MEERRSLLRWKIEKEAKVWLPQIQESRVGMIEDMSLTGMRMSFDKQLPKEDPLMMFFVLSDRFTTFKSEVRIPWGKEKFGRYAYGLSFKNITEDEKGKIHWYIQLL